MELDEIEPSIRSESEEILSSNKSRKLVDFWRWAYSDLIGNTERGCFAEYLVAIACNIDHKVRISWNSYDLELDDGTKIEVKSSAYLQSWKQKEYSKPIFGIQKTKSWDYRTGQYDVTKKRQSDIYVFALLSHKTKSTVNPLDTSQWEFYILQTSVIDLELGESKQVSLDKLKQLNAIKSSFDDILDKIQLTKNIEQDLE